MATLLKANGERRVVFPSNGKTFSLEELQNYVGGYIEILPTIHHDGRVLVVDEEGTLKRRQFNFLATQVYGRHYAEIVGDALVCNSNEIE